MSNPTCARRWCAWRNLRRDIERQAEDWTLLATEEAEAAYSETDELRQSVRHERAAMWEQAAAALRALLELPEEA